MNLFSTNPKVDLFNFIFLLIVIVRLFLWEADEWFGAMQVNEVLTK